MRAPRSATAWAISPPLPGLSDPATLGCIEHGILAPLGWFVKRSNRTRPMTYYAAQPNDDDAGWSIAQPQCGTFVEALIVACELASEVAP